MDTTTLRQILHEEMCDYAGEGFNSVSYLAINEEAQVYVVVDFANILGKRVVGSVLIARLVDNMVIIDLDLNDKMLVDALLV